MASQRTQQSAIGQAEEAAEQKHFDEVVMSFTEYRLSMLHEIQRRERHLLCLPDTTLTRLCGGRPSAEAKIAAAEDAVDVNQAQLLEIVRPHLAENRLLRGREISPAFASRVRRKRRTVEHSGSLPAVQSARRNIEKVNSTLHQLSREWAAEGREEREQCFGPILAELKAWLPVQQLNRQRVVVPGVGLGRLAAEICGLGYACQGNEFSYHMLLTSTFVLNQLRVAEEFAVHPWIDQPCNAKRSADITREVRVPDTTAIEILSQNPEGDLSMVAGEFIEVYGTDHCVWDGVVTCFFLDTAPNVVDYVRTIRDILKPGGVWVNHGPLLWHWYAVRDEATDDERYKQSVELGYDEVRSVIESFGFEFLTERWGSQCNYASNPLSMMATTYSTILFTVRKPLEAPRTEPSAAKKPSLSVGLR